MSTSRTYSEEELIAGCLRGELLFQKLLYKHFYGYAMNLCLRYSNSREEASEVLNDGFLKVFSKIASYTPEKAFKGWLRKIMINAAIDNYRKQHQHYHTVDLVYAEQETVEVGAIDHISAEEILKMVQLLPPAYRLIFNLYAIDGLTHPEIAEQLNISEGTSKSNLHKARLKLQRMIELHHPEQYSSYAK